MVACIALVALGSLLVPVSILGVWLHNQVTNTDRYVATVTPLASDPDIQAAIANRVTNTLYDQVDVPAEVKSVLPEQAGFLATPIASGLRTVVHEIVLRIVQSDQFATLWVAANRFAHKQVVDVLTSDKAPKGAVVIDLTGVAKAATSKLESAGLPLFDRISSGSSQRKLEFEVFRSDDVANIQSSFKLFEKIATILPWLTILILAAAVFVAPNRRRGLVWAASGFTIGAALILIGLTVGRSIYLAALPRGTSRPANEAFFDTLTRFVRSGTRTVVAVGLVVLLAALIFGPSGPAVGIRRFFSRITGRLGAQAGEHGADLGPVGVWVGRNIGALRIAVAVLAAAVLILWSGLTAAVVLWVAIIAVLVLAVIEVIGRAGQAGADHDAAPPAVPPPVTQPPSAG